MSFIHLAMTVLTLLLKMKVKMVPQHAQHEKDQMHHLYKLFVHPVLAPETTCIKI